MIRTYIPCLMFDWSDNTELMAGAYVILNEIPLSLILDNWSNLPWITKLENWISGIKVTLLWLALSSMFNGLVPILLRINQIIKIQDRFKQISKLVATSAGWTVSFTHQDTNVLFTPCHNFEPILTNSLSNDIWNRL